MFLLQQQTAEPRRESRACPDRGTGSGSITNRQYSETAVSVQSSGAAVVLSALTVGELARGLARTSEQNPTEQGKPSELERDSKTVRGL